MQILKNKVLQSKHKRKFLLDTFYKKTKTKKPVIIFVHGFKGFKDWGFWDLLCNKIAEQNFVVLKFNFSHNGTTIKNPTEFEDLAAFGENNFSKELDDLETVINWIEQQNDIENNEIDLENINLLGHSRGGGIVLLKAAENKKINKICTLASVSNFNLKWTNDVVEYWKAQGKILILNGRTKQQMPLNFQLYQNYIDNIERLEIERNCKKIKNEVLLIHGTNDNAVNFSAMLALKSWLPKSKTFTIENANHVFGGKHPYNEKELPNDIKKAMNEFVTFFKE